MLCRNFQFVSSLIHIATNSKEIIEHLLCYRLFRNKTLLLDNLCKTLKFLHIPIKYRWCWNQFAWLFHNTAKHKHNLPHRVFLERIQGISSILAAQKKL